MSWKNVNYNLIEIPDPASFDFIVALKALYVNGNVILKHFEPQDVAQSKQAHFNDLKGLDFLRTFLQSASVMTVLSDEINLTVEDVQSMTYSNLGAHEFEGALTHALLRSGAYIRFRGTEDDARKLSRDFVDAILPNGRFSALVFVIEGAWTDWYFDVAWDMTYVIYDIVGRRWSVLCATDTD